MFLTLITLRCPDTASPETKKILGGEFKIGRGLGNDWVIEDPQRYLSKQHCVISFFSGRYMLSDTSTNGTYLNGEKEPIGADAGRELRSGDRIIFGAYEVEVKISQKQDYKDVNSSSNVAPFDVHPYNNSFNQDVDGIEQSFFGKSFNQPNFSFLNKNPFSIDGEKRDEFSANSVELDRNSSLNDAFTPPLYKQIIPDDDWSLLVPQQPVAPEPQRVLPPLPPRPKLEPSNPFSKIIAEPLPSDEVLISKEDLHKSTSSKENSNALFSAFLEGAGIKTSAQIDTESLMLSLGRTMRALVSGIRKALIARAKIKGEFRIEQTMIRTHGNNPFKFSADDDDALMAILGLDRHVGMAPDVAVRDALRDICHHELAMMVAMQGAVRSLLARFNPTELQTEGNSALLPAQKKARAYEAYEKLYQKMTKALDDDFDDVFGKYFAQIYETALVELSAQDSKDT